MTDYDDLTQRMRKAVGVYGSMSQRDALLRDGADAITSLAQGNADVTTTAIANPYDRELRMEAMRAAKPGMTETHVEAAQELYRFLTGATEYREARSSGDWLLPTGEPGEGWRERLERTVGLALGAASVAWTGQPQGVFESAYVSGIMSTLMAAIDAHTDEAKRRGRDRAQDMYKLRAEAWDALWQIVGGGELIDLDTAQQRIIDHLRDGEPKPPAHGLAVGDTIGGERIDAVRTWLDRLPEGAVIADKDGDTYTKQDGGNWGGRYAENGENGVAWLASHQELSIESLPEPTPEPEDTTPRVGDTVRVAVERLGHLGCVGYVGPLGRNGVASSGIIAYQVSDPERGKHIGPLSDFELIERAK
jgi:hypothetical protein